MNLDQLLKLEGIDDYYIFWYGSEVALDYMDCNGLFKGRIEINKGKPKNDNTIYIFLAGINKYNSRYMFAAKLYPTESPDIFEVKKVNIKLDEYAGRLILRRNTGFSFYSNKFMGPDFIVDEIWGKETHRTVKQFLDYDSVELSFDELKEVIDNHYPDYYKALSSVKGIYMIIDGNTGKLYVGSASGNDGIWGRWSDYASTYHGKNEELIKLFNDNKEEYFKKFKYIILQILPTKTSKKEIDKIESKYKERFLTRIFGLNNN